MTERVEEIRRRLGASECAVCGKVSRTQDPLLIAAIASVFMETGEPDWMCAGHEGDV